MEPLRWYDEALKVVLFASQHIEVDRLWYTGDTGPVRILPECPVGNATPLDWEESFPDPERVVFKLTLDIASIVFKIGVNDGLDAIVAF